MKKSSAIITMVVEFILLGVIIFSFIQCSNDTKKNKVVEEPVVTVEEIEPPVVVEEPIIVVEEAKEEPVVVKEEVKVIETPVVEEVVNEDDLLFEDISYEEYTQDEMTAEVAEDLLKTGIIDVYYELDNGEWIYRCTFYKGDKFHKVQNMGKYPILYIYTKE